MRFVFFAGLSATFLLSSCNNPAQQTQPKVYYDVVSYVNAQINDFSARKPVVQKTLRLNAERSRQTSRDLNWNRELELFLQTDINKPALRSSYTISRPDSLTYQYRLKNNEERLTVRSLDVRLDSATRQPRQITAVLQTKNPLYASERHLLLESGAAKGRWQIQRYRLSGFQQLSYFDRSEFEVEGRVSP